LFIFASAVQAEEIKGDKNAGQTDARRLAKSGMADDGPTSTFLTLIVGKSKWKTKDSSSGMVLLTALPVITQRVWEV
jgi:hypothetical protein